MWSLYKILPLKEISKRWLGSLCVTSYNCMQVLVAQSSLTLCNPMDCSPQGSSAYGIFPARILEWVVIPFSRESSQPKDQTQVSCIAGRFFTIRDTGKPYNCMWVYNYLRLRRWFSGKESTCQCRRCRRLEFDPWVGKIPWRIKWQPAPVFLSGEFHGQRSLVGYSPWVH